MSLDIDVEEADIGDVLDLLRELAEDLHGDFIREYPEVAIPLTIQVGTFLAFTEGREWYESKPKIPCPIKRKFKFEVFGGKLTIGFEVNGIQLDLGGESRLVEWEGPPQPGPGEEPVPAFAGYGSLEWTF